MKNKKGFTIVELLITIAVVVSILAVAILAFSKLSNKHIASSWDEIKSEMKLAATQYLDVNEYLINDLSDSESVYITLETLVNENYLSLLSNPVTGEQLDKCDVVKVSKAKEYTYLTKSEAIEEIGEEYFANGCSVEPTVVSDSERAKLKISIYKASNDACAIGAEYKTYTFTTSRSETTDWFNKSNYPNGIVVKLSIVNGSKFNVTYNDGGKNKYSNYSADSLTICTNSDQKMNDLSVTYGNVTASVKINLDLNAPIIKVDANKTNVLENAKNYVASEKYYNRNWYKGYVWVGATATDLNSNVKTFTYKRTNDSSLGGSTPQNIQIDNNSKQAYIRDYSAQEGISNYSYKACDEAGNCSSSFEYCNENSSCLNINEFTVMLDHTAPTIDLKGYITNSDTDIINDLTSAADKKGVSKSSLLNSYINNNNLKVLSSGTWTNKAIAVKAGFDDKLSGIVSDSNACVDPRSDKTKYPNFNTYRRVMSTAEGEYKFNCTIKDNAGNVTTNSYVVKRDITAPVCTLTASGNIKIIEKYDKNKISVKEDKSKLVKDDDRKTYYVPIVSASNKTVSVTNSNYNETKKKYFLEVEEWYTSDVNLTFECSDNNSGVAKKGLFASKHTYNENITDSNKNTQKKDTKSVTWGGTVMDSAGNVAKYAIKIKKDTKAPTVVKSGAGAMKCLKKDSKIYHNSYGYSVKFTDETSKATIRSTQYYSSSSCNSFYWAYSEQHKSFNAGVEGIYTFFAGCDNNTKPRLDYILIDEAGNYSLNTLTATKGKIEQSSGKECSSSKWFNESPNR